MKEASALFRLLGDEARLRLLRVLARDRFNVTELTGILGLAQSGVSRHLGLLKDAGLVVEERDGAFTYYRLAPALRATARAALAAARSAVRGDGRHAGGAEADEARLQEVLRLRRENFDQHAGPDTRDGRQLVPGRSWAAWARALGHLLPPLDVADLGCGEGYLTSRRRGGRAASSPSIARPTCWRAPRRWPARRRMRQHHLEARRARAAAARRRVGRRRAAVAGAAPRRRSGARRRPKRRASLRPGGRVLVLDLRAHDEAWVREKLGDRWLGFADDPLRALLDDAGLDDVTVSVGARRTGDPFTVLVAARATKGRRATANARQTSFDDRDATA